MHIFVPLLRIIINKMNHTPLHILLFLITLNTYCQNVTNTDSTSIQELTDIVITATRTQRQLSSLPLPVTIVSKEKILQSGSIRLNDILSEQTGIVTTTDRSGFEGIQIQGIASDYILILIDGVPLVGRQSGNFNLERLAVGNIEQIEVVKGPSSSLYGSEALGGVINIITKKPKEKTLSGNVSYTASYRADVFTQQDMNLELEQSLGKFRYAIFANRFSSEGYDIIQDDESQTIEPFENYTFNNRLYYDMNEKVSLFYSARYYNQSQDDERFSSETNTRYSGEAIEEDLNSHLKINHKWAKKLETTYEFYYTNYKNATDLISDQNPNDIIASFFDRKLLRPELRGTYAFSKDNKITMGVGFQYDELDRTYTDQKVNFNSQYLYGQYDVKPFEGLNIIVGARFDNHSEYENQLSPKLALRYQITDEISTKASVGYGFKAPDFRQLYLNFTNPTAGYTVLGYNVAVEERNELASLGFLSNIAVPDSELLDPLKAESSIGYNLGMTYKKGKFNTEINLFRNDFSNLIDTRVIARKTNGLSVFSYVNVDESYSTGIEFNTSIKLYNALTISGGYQLLYFYNKNVLNEIDRGEKFVRDPITQETKLVKRSDYFGIPNRSRHQANLKVFCNFPTIKSNINLRLLYRSKYALFDTNGNEIIDPYDQSYVDGYVTANIAASKALYKNFNLQLGANNLFNYRDLLIPNLPGIQGYARINYQF